MTLWIKNANIATMDKARPYAQAAVVIGGFFAKRRRRPILVCIRRRSLKR